MIKVIASKIEKVFHLFINRLFKVKRQTSNENETELKRVSILIKKDTYVIYPQSQTVDGIWLASKPFIFLPIFTPQFEIAQNILIALRNSQFHIANPTNWKKQEDEYLNSIKERSLKQLHETTKMCEIEQKKEEITIFPMINKGKNDGYENAKNKEISVSINEFENYLFESFKQCR
jgi:DNA modification methylase